MRASRLVPLVSIAVVFAVGCAPGTGPGGNGGTGDPTADLTQWNNLAAQLAAKLTNFLGPDVQELAAVGDQLYWLDETNFDPALRRYDDASGGGGAGGAMVAYTFSIGDANSYNYRASSSLVVTADGTADPPAYHAYDATKPNADVGDTTSPQPSGAAYNAYAVDGGTVYIVDTSVPGTTALMKWIPGQAQTQVTTLESAGATIGEFDDFGVSGSTMVFVESGRIWTLDLATNKATFLMNTTQVAGDASVDFESDGVLFTTDTGLDFYSYAKAAIVDVAAAIDANPYQVNATYSTASNYAYDFARWKSYVVYIGGAGVFAYDLGKNTITPVLLEPIGAATDVQYRYPVVLDDGTAFVTGLMSTDGATGADGPTYKFSLTSTLP